MEEVVYPDLFCDARAPRGATHFRRQSVAAVVVVGDSVVVRRTPRGLELPADGVRGLWSGDGSSETSAGRRVWSRDVESDLQAVTRVLADQCSITGVRVVRLVDSDVSCVVGASGGVTRFYLCELTGQCSEVGLLVARPEALGVGFVAQRAAAEWCVARRPDTMVAMPSPSELKRERQAARRGVVAERVEWAADAKKRAAESSRAGGGYRMPSRMLRGNGVLLMAPSAALMPVLPGDEVIMPRGTRR